MPHYLLLLFFLLFELGGNAQNNISGLDSLSGSLIESLHAKSNDKILLTSDKRFYKVGERIWFRGFIINAISNRISTRNKVVYAELIDEKDKSITHAVLNAGRQLTSGNLLISDSLPTGNYWLRAYTKQMAEEDPLSSAVLSLYIYNSKLGDKANKKRDSSENIPIIDIYPEGGNIITATDNEVAIYAHNMSGDPLELKAILIDNRSKDSIPVITNKYGIGDFIFFPNRFKNYTLVTKFNEKLYSFPLPGFNFWAGQVSLKKMKNNELLIRTVLEDSLNKLNKTNYLIAIHNGKLFYANMGDGSYKSTISLEKLPNGIVTFLLFNYKFELLSERSICINKPDAQITISTNKHIYKKRDIASATIKVTDIGNHQITSSVCINVIDSMTQIISEEIEREELIQRLTYKRLDERALLHFQNLSDPQIDQLLLCQPSLVKNLPNNHFAQSHLADSLFYISGQLVNTKNIPLTHKEINLISDSKNGTFISDSTDENGKFSIPLKDVIDRSLYWLQVNNSKNKTEEFLVRLDSFSIPSFKTPSILRYFIPLHIKQLSQQTPSFKNFNSINEEKSLKEVVVRTEIKKNLDYDENDRVSRNTFILTPTMIHRAGTSFIGNALRMVPGLQVLNGYVILGGLNDMKGPNKDAEPLVLVDGVQAYLNDPPPAAAYESPVLYYFNSLNANDIDFIEIFKGPEASRYGLRGGNGVIYIHTAKRNFEYLSRSKPAFVKLYSPGFTKEEFYINPNYELNYFKEFNSDKRNTLFWVGNELINSKTNNTISFFTSDISSTFFIEITGITEHSEFIYGKKQFKVE